MDLSNCLRHSAFRYGDKIALKDGQRQLTYTELNQRVNKLAHVLLGLGLQRGDKVAILLDNSIEFAESMCAIIRAGMTFVPVNSKLKKHEVKYILEHSDSRCLIVDEEILEGSQGAWDCIDPEKTLVVGGRTSNGIHYEDALSQASDQPIDIVINPDDTFFIGYTSGTTGRPKGVVVSHRSRILTCLLTAQKYQLGQNDVGLMCTPMYHGGPMIFVIVSIMTGACLVIMKKFDAEEALYQIQEHGVTNIFVVSTILSRFARLPSEQFNKYNLQSLRLLVSNAGPLPTNTKEETLDLFPWVELHELYGSTEASLVTNLRHEYQREKIRCCGQPLLWVEIKLLDDQGNEVDVGEPGELFSRSPYNFDGYYKNEEETRKAIRPDGFVTVGDVAIRDEDNFYYIVDRKKDMIISGGVNIYSREVEEVLNTHPKIKQSAIVGVPHPEWGEQVKAFIELEAGETMSAEEVIEHCASQLASFKKPRLVEFLEELPRNSTGKVLKSELKKLSLG